MNEIDQAAFRERGAHGCSNSHFAFCQTTCCGAWCVEDEELSDLYFDSRDLSAVIPLFASDDEPLLCPVCGASSWNCPPVEKVEDVPEQWLWALRR